jgi:hypothetical protein
MLCSGRFTPDKFDIAVFPCHNHTVETVKHLVEKQTAGIRSHPYLRLRGIGYYGHFGTNFTLFMIL